MSGYRREQCHLCPTDSGDVPHVAYRADDKVISLYLVPAGKVKIEYRPVHNYTMTNDVQYIPPKARVY